MSAFYPGLALVALMSLASCGEMALNDTASTPSLAEQGCLRDVSNLTGNGQVVVISTLDSEAGTQVTVGVGPDRAPWQCIGYKDGTTAGIMSLTDEGAL